MGWTAAIGAVGAGVQALGAISAGNASAAQSNYQAQVAENNRIIAEQNAAYSLQAGSTKAADRSLLEGGRQGALRAGLSATGIDVNTGSAADVQVSQKEAGTLNVENVWQDALLKAYGYRTQATGYQAEAGLDRQKASYDTSAGYLKGIGSLLGSASTLPDKFSWMSGGSGGGGAL